MSACRRVVGRWARRRIVRSAGRASLPWSSTQELSDAIALGRQVITVMATGCLVAAGHLSGHVELGYAGALHAFEAGAFWVSFVDHSRLLDKPPDEPTPRPFGQPPRRQ